MSTPPARPTTTVLLVRDVAEGLEVLMVVRKNGLSSRAAMSFPGGPVDQSDGDEAWLPLCRAVDDIDAAERVRRIAGYRTLYQQTGLLPVVGGRASADGTGSFIDQVGESGGQLDLSVMAAFAHWVTPENSPKRYDTFFRLCWWDAANGSGALSHSAEWHSPREALELSEAGHRYVLVPTKCQLDLLARSATVESAIAETNARRIVTVSPQVASDASTLVLTIPSEAGYPRTEFKIDRALL